MSYLHPMNGRVRVRYKKEDTREERCKTPHDKTSAGNRCDRLDRWGRRQHNRRASLTLLFLDYELPLQWDCPESPSWLSDTHPRPRRNDISRHLSIFPWFHQARRTGGPSTRGPFRVALFEQSRKKQIFPYAAGHSLWSHSWQWLPLQW